MNDYIEIDKALNRLKWTIQRKGNEDDITTFNSVLMWIEAQRDRHFNSHTAVSKLFSWLFIHKCWAVENDVVPDAKSILTEIQKIVETPVQQYVEELMQTVPLLRFSRVYKDYESDLRKARRRAFKNSIPAEQSTALTTEFRGEDLQLVLEENNAVIDQVQKDLSAKLLTPYTREEAEYFIKSKVTELLRIATAIEQNTSER